jgi:hypothetical protein
MATIINKSVKHYVPGLKKLYCMNDNSLNLYCEFEDKNFLKNAATGIQDCVKYTFSLARQYPNGLPANEINNYPHVLDILRSDLYPLKSNKDLIVGFSAKHGGGLGLPIKTLDELITKILNAMSMSNNRDINFETPIENINDNELSYKFM